MPKITLWGFSGSTYVRTVRMLLAEKGVTDYEQVPIDVLKGEPKTPEHLERHPFGKVPVIDIDRVRLIETPAIARYLDAVLPGPSLVPPAPLDAARMDMVTSIIDSYAYGPTIMGVVAYHLFPDVVGGKNEEAHRNGLETARKAFEVIFERKGDDPWLAGQDISIADLYLAPHMAYLSMTPDGEEFAAMPGVGDWWERLSARDSFRSTAP